MRDNRPVISGEPTYYSGLDDLSGKSETEKLAWFRGRFEKIIIRPLQEVRVLGPTKQHIWDLNLGVVTIICSAIEALGSFYAPNGGTDRSRFILFVNAFMDQGYRATSPAQQETYADILYGQFRCGLAHGLSIEGHEVATRPGAYIVDVKGYVSIDLWSLFEDMQGAFERYLAKARADSQCRKDFIQRFDQIFVRPYK